jgi:hypothetical protein
MVRSKAKEEKISTISNPARTQLPGVWAEEKIKKYDLQTTKWIKICSIAYTIHTMGRFLPRTHSGMHRSS